jgi:ubiquinone biosynthesis protein COQ4
METLSPYFHVDNKESALIITVTITENVMMNAAPNAALAQDPLAQDPLAQDATALPAFVRWRRALTALAQVMVDPEKTDQVLVFSIYANAGSMPKRIHRFFESESGRRLYQERRMIASHTIDLDALAELPDGTLGHAYATFLRSRGLTPAVFDAPPSQVTDPRIQYVVQRLRQTHDLWHVVTGHDTDPASEIALQAFTFAQVRAPSSAILATVGTLRALREVPGIARSVFASLLLGLRAAPLPVFPWEDYWATPLTDVRKLLGIPADGVKSSAAARATSAVTN